MPRSTTVTYDVIGVVRSSFHTLEDTPVQSAASQGARGSIELDPRHLDALEGLDGFSYIWVVTHLHGLPRRDEDERREVERGALATRSPSHPNPIGISVLELIEIDGASLDVAGLDLLDGTPVLDVKPYVPLFDSIDREPVALTAEPAGNSSRELPATRHPIPETEGELVYFLNHARSGMPDEPGRARTRRRGPRVRDVMFRSPKALPREATVGDVRAQFRSSRVRVALLVHRGVCRGLIRRSDIPPAAEDGDAAAWFAHEPATISASATLPEAHRRLREADDRRLVVVDRRNRVQGLLCHNHSGTGFCSDTARCAEPAGGSGRTRWTIIRRTSDGRSHRDLLLATSGKRIHLGDLLTLPPERHANWLVVDTREAAADEDAGIAVVERFDDSERRDL
jgi:tRNA-Thr(GGU) m(6)t(6)A37 methyltransferase TsaA